MCLIQKKLSVYLFSRACLKHDTRELFRLPIKFLLNHLIFPRKSWYAAFLRGVIINLISRTRAVSYVFKDVSASSYGDLRLGKDSVIEEGTIIDGPLTLGELCVIGKRVFIEGPVVLGRGSTIRDGSVVIRHTTLEEWVAVSIDVKFITFNHEIGPEDLRCGKLSYNPIVVKSGAWLGAGVTILPGVTIGRGCVIGAGSIVTRSIPDNCIAAGIPARVIRKLGPGEGGAIPAELEKAWEYEKW